MKILDDLKEIKKLDPGRTLDSIQAFPKQISQAWDQSHGLDHGTEFGEAENIVIAGMGGSALAGRIVKSLFEKEIKVPFQVVTEYGLPAFVDEKSLVVVVSYSGNTEETLSCFREAKKRGARIFAITTGGKLAEEIKQETPGLIFEPKDNYLGYPKTAIGYILGALMGSLAKIGWISLSTTKFKEELTEFEKIQSGFWAEKPTKNNPAKQVANFLKGKIGVIVASEHLNGAAWTFRNQINEIAHSFSVFADLPEMNHHLVEALTNPVELKGAFHYLFIRSKNYFSRVDLRYQVTQKVLTKQKIKWGECILKASGKLAEAFEVIQLGGFVSVYLSILNQQDPGPEPWILYLKKELKKVNKKES